MSKRAAVAIAVGLFVTLFPDAARASVATSCSFDAGTATVTAVIGSGDSPTLVRDGDAITFGGLPCGVATIANTDEIDVADADPNSGEALTVSLAGGRFAPGKTPEDDGTDEIEIDVAQSFPGPLTIVGTDVADHFYVCSGDINLNENVSGDTEIFMPVIVSMTTVDGGSGDDVLRTKMYQSDVSGGGGNDVLYPMDYGPSTYDGGPGDDMLSYASQAPANGGWGEIHAIGGGDATIVRGFSLQDTAHGIETFEGFGAPTKYFGSAEADHFIGTSYNDWFLPLGGDDVIDGGPTFDGSELGDTDVLSVAASGQPETFDMDTRTATGEGTDSYADVEVLSGSPQDDTFVGNAARAGLIGIDGGGGDDVLDFGSVLAPQTVYLGPATPPGPLWVTGIEKVIGSNRGDVFVFTSGDVAARFLGRHGNDTLIGGHLDDVLLGGKGDDTIDGKRGVDTCRGGGGQDTVTHCERS